MERVNVRRLPDDWGADEEALLQAIDDATATRIYIAYRVAPEWFDRVHAPLPSRDLRKGYGDILVLEQAEE